MKTSLIVAMGENRAIGKENAMPWHLPADLKHFRKITTGHHIIMGRNTYESIGKPLPNRVSIVITRNPDYQADGCIVVHTLADALSIANREGETEAFIIGGAQIYQQALPLVDRLYLTKIHQAFDADTFFPEIDLVSWKLVDEDYCRPDEKNPYSYSFVTLER